MRIQRALFLRIHHHRDEALDTDLRIEATFDHILARLRHVEVPAVYLRLNIKVSCSINALSVTDSLAFCSKLRR